MHSENWDDLRFVLAAAETGSVSGAARALGVNHATVLRRIASFEDRHGVTLFRKTGRGYEIPEDKRRVIQAARDAEAAMAAVTRLMRGEQAPVQGVIRVTTTDTFSLTVLPEIMARLQDKDPGLRLELITTAVHLDFGRLRADIAVRPAHRLPDDLAGEQAATLGFAVYAPADEEGAGWLDPSGVLASSVAADWLADNVSAEDRVGSADSFVVLSKMVAQGIGRTVLPCILGDREKGVRRASGILDEITVPVWVASHVDLADAGRLRSVRRALTEGLDPYRDALAGISASEGA